MSRIPEMRFDGFTEPWEQRKFSDLYAPLVERNSDLLPYNKTLSVATMTYKTDGNGAADSSLANYKRLRTGDIAFEGHTSKSFRYGRFVLNDVGDGIMSPRFSALRPLAQMPSNFWKYYIHYEPIMRKILVASTKAGTMMNELVIDEFLKSSVLIPSIEEQTRIGSILKNIDNLITLHQRKYDRLKNLKKAYLEKMFPKDGETVPEMRLDGFTEPWEQHKFGDIGSVAMCKRVFKEQTFDEGEVPFYKIGTFGGEPDAYISRELFDEYKTKYPYPNKGDILISASGSIGRTVEFTGKDEYFQDSNIVWLKHGKEIDNSFLKILYSVVEWSCEGSTIKRLYNDNFLKTEFMLPQIDEQKKIGEYFNNLDHLITLHQHRLERLKHLKQAYLQKMFA